MTQKTIIFQVIKHECSRCKNYHEEDAFGIGRDGKQLKICKHCREQEKNKKLQLEQQTEQKCKKCKCIKRIEEFGLLKRGNGRLKTCISCLQSAVELSLDKLTIINNEQEIKIPITVARIITD